MKKAAYIFYIGCLILLLSDIVKAQQHGPKNISESIERIIHSQSDSFTVLDSLLETKPNWRPLSKYEKLKIHSDKIKRLPRSIRLYKNINYLTLLMPRLKRIPKHIARFTELKNLDVNYSGRTKLPSNLAKKLNGLSVTVGKGAKKNALRNLKKFTKLKSLGISGMAPDWKPKKLFGLDQLEELYINFCHFNKIDFTGSFLKGLEELDLEDNELIELPTGLDNLPKLTILRLSHNKIEQLPNDICKLKQIIYLYLDDNNIKTLRDSISEMKNLQKISLKNNPIPASEKERLKKALPDVEFVFE